MRFKHLPHTDICKAADFRAESNNLAYARLVNKRREEKVRMSVCFRSFLLMFSHKSTAYNLQMTHFWRWLVSQIGISREYVYMFGGEELKEVLTLINIESTCDGVIVVYKTKSGKKEWKEYITTSPFFNHWKTANQKAEKYIID